MTLNCYSGCLKRGSDPFWYVGQALVISDNNKYPVMGFYTGSAPKLGITIHF